MSLIVKLQDPQIVKSLLQIDDATRKQIEQHKNEIKQIVNKKDNRKLIIIGPCSADFPETILEYAKEVMKLQEQYKDKLKFVLRVYSSKPRTVLGWKGMIMSGEYISKKQIKEITGGSGDEQDFFEKVIGSSSEPNLMTGIETTRKLMLDITKLGLAVGDEMLYPNLVEYFDDILSYVAIGARSCENQMHREVASLIDIPVGVKNPTSGDLNLMLNSLQAVKSPQQVILGSAQYLSSGNESGHVILRGSNINGKSVGNIGKDDFEKLGNLMTDRGFSGSIVVDLNHDNSGKNGLKQPENILEIIDLISKNRGIESNLGKVTGSVVGFMIESYMFDCNQKDTGEEIKKGLSLTDSCLGIEKTKVMLEGLYKSL